MVEYSSSNKTVRSYSDYQPWFNLQSDPPEINDYMQPPRQIGSVQTKHTIASKSIEILENNYRKYISTHPANSVVGNYFSL